MGEVGRVPRAVLHSLITSWGSQPCLTDRLLFFLVFTTAHAPRKPVDAGRATETSPSVGADQAPENSPTGTR